MKKFLFVAGVFYLFMVASCKKSVDFQMPPLSDYYPLQVGKYITYEVDSLVFPSGNRGVIDSCEMMYVVAAQITDNLGRPAYRIDTYIRYSPNDPWVSNYLTDMVVNTGNAIEFDENNLRYLKLEEPLSAGYSWQGNRYIDVSVPPIGSSLPDLSYFADWDYTYDSLYMPTTLGSLIVDSTISVQEEPYTVTGAVLTGNPTLDIYYSGLDYSSAKYAKGIGLVYRTFLHQIWQPPVNGFPGSFMSSSYGVTMTMIDHN